MTCKYRLPLALVILLTALLVFAAAAGASPADIRVYQPAETPSDIFVQDEILVKFKPAVGSTEIDRINKGLGIAESHRTYSGVFRLKVPEKRLAEMIEIYNRLPMVDYAEPNYIAHAFLTPNDSYYQYQWHMSSIRMEPAWEIQTGSPNVVVAVVDTGVAYEDYSIYTKAPDLGTNFVPGYDFINGDSHPNDDNSHGTHVTGTIAQSTNNGAGVAGIAFNTSIMPVKVLNSSGSGTYTAIADGIKWAADNGAKVINMSLGSSFGSLTLEDAVRYAYIKGVTIIAAAGNDGISMVSYPAAYNDYVIAVGATRYDNTRSKYSNYGSSLDLVAPGGDVNVDQNGDSFGDGVLQNTFDPNTKNTSDFGYWFLQGTSMAAPHVAGVAALLIADGVTGPDEVRNVLQSSAKDLGAAGRDKYYGYGLVDAYAALTYAEPVPINNAPVASNNSYSVNEGEVLTVAAPGVLGNDSDIDGDVLVAVKLSDPSSGTLEFASNGSFAYTPVSPGTVTFTYKANDGELDSNIATVTITVNEAYEPPANDTIEPVWPDGSKISVTATTKTSLILNWPAAADAVGVTSYHIYKNGTDVGNVSGSALQYKVTGLTSKTGYTFGVEAYDAAGNRSEMLSGTARTK
jgi:serine protease